ncbi:hypothetical protein [Novosphingobium album (ex Liu et al. 2023)]|uniref:Uncharacterized protein n=1 Tax=Novosphingobium album (ex Liu et al. 2023) TaxID=3031130 RepID=A0ABT5WPN4_9SPHN|nr:hypothetical protein [Novosphingobium album (ex Liu et al. 2023)]MDE8651997.1 hypothetical protein [Novosphingobium album (ex Liu et al. 2023)]
MSATMTLPEGFADLAELAARWARPTENARSAIRWTASAEDFAALHAAMMPRLDAVLARLEGCPLDGMDSAETRLFCLAAAFAEAAPHHELYGGSAEVPHSFSARRFVPGHGDTPSWSTALR